jgi:maltose/moltooligosaccharide transporter
MEGSTAGLGVRKPVMGFRGLWNISFGFFGIQIGFALQNANMSRIFSRSAPRSTIFPLCGSPRR